MNTREKGTKYEKEVANIFAAHGWEVRGLESGGDHLIVARGGLLLASECKRGERLKIPEWWRQAKSDPPPAAVPMLSFRQNHQESLTLLRTVDLARLLGQ